MNVAGEKSLIPKDVGSPHCRRANFHRSARAVSRITPVDYKKFDKFLKYVGCEFVRQKGDHRVYSKASLKRPVIIPAIRDIPVFIILNNLKILGIDREDYLSIIHTL